MKNLGLITVDNTFSRHRNGLENGAFAILVLWILLPVAMSVICVYYGFSYGYDKVFSDVTHAALFELTLAAYRRAFLVLGSVTILLAIVSIALHWKTVISRESLTKQPWLYIFAALLAWAAVSTALSDNPAAAFGGSGYRTDGLFSYFVYAAVFCCALSIKEEWRRKALFRMFVMVVDVLCVIMVCEALHVHPIRQFFQSPYASVFNQFNHFGYVLCMSSLCSAALFLWDRSKAFGPVYILSFAFQYTTLLINDTFGCYLAAIVGLLAIFVFWFRCGQRPDARLIVPVALAVLLSLASYGGAFSAVRNSDVGSNFSQLANDLVAIEKGDPEARRAGTGRMALWAEAVGMIPERPLFGYGPEGLTGDYMAKMGVDRPHNEFIQYAVFLGVPALLLYLAALITMTAMQWRRLKKLPATTVVAAVVVVGYLASSFVGNTMFNTAPYFWMTLGFASCLPDGKSLLTEPSEECFGKLPQLVKVIAVPICVTLALSVVFLGMTL